MTDRELLEKAAKAAGLKKHRYCEAWRGMAEYTPEDGYFGPTWNPVTDDGDALRLAVKLRMVVSLAYCTCCAVVDWADNEDENEVMVRFGEDFPDREATDALAATRRAIVRAAAALADKAAD